MKVHPMGENGPISGIEDHIMPSAKAMLADLVVHSRDLLTIPPRKILQTGADITVFDGRVVYERK